MQRPYIMRDEEEHCLQPLQPGATDCRTPTVQVPDHTVQCQHAQDEEATDWISCSSKAHAKYNKYHNFWGPTKWSIHYPQARAISVTVYPQSWTMRQTHSNYIHAITYSYHHWPIHTHNANTTMLITTTTTISTQIGKRQARRLSLKSRNDGTNAIHTRLQFAVRGNIQTCNQTSRRYDMDAHRGQIELLLLHGNQSAVCVKQRDWIVHGFYVPANTV